MDKKMDQKMLPGSLKAVVNRIIPFSSVDGLGNRTAIFLQGCNIDCRYCHNPETRKLCVNCGVCVKNCPAQALSVSEAGTVEFAPERCVQCDTCIHICPHDSSPRTCQMTADEVFAAVKKQIPFIRGITVSGGECMLQPKFLKELFFLARQAGLTTLIDSNGTIPFAAYPGLLEVTDGVMLDIKAFSAEEHKIVTGADNRTVLDNAVFLAEQGKLQEVRMVIVPDLYDTESSVRGIGSYLLPWYQKNRFDMKIIAYRPMGVREAYSHYAVPDSEYLKYLGGILSDMGYEKIVLI